MPEVDTSRTSAPHQMASPPSRGRARASVAAAWRTDADERLRFAHAGAVSLASAASVISATRRSKS